MPKCPSSVIRTSVHSNPSRPALSASLMFVRAMSIVGLVVLACPVRSAAQEQVKPLTIKVRNGEGDTHKPGDKFPKTIEVQVINDLEIPQPQAQVTFRSAKDEPGVLFDSTPADTVKVEADENGLARVDVSNSNWIKGAVKIAVEARFEDKVDRLDISQVNGTRFFTTGRKILLLCAAGAAAGILYAVFKPGPPTAATQQPTVGVNLPRAAQPAVGFSFRIR